MRQSVFSIAVILSLFASATVSLAVEPTLEFIEGLRQRRYYDSALQYLDRVEADPSTPQPIQEVISYERAQTLLQSAQELTNLDAQRKQLEAAQAAFEAFVKATPTHQLAGRANSARGNILLEKARVEIWDGQKPSNEGARETYFDTARNYIKEARRIFERAQDQHKKAWEAFPTYISEEEKQQRAARDAAEVQYMEAQLDLAQATYWEAQTIKEEDPQRKEILTKAAFEFEEIHKKYRSLIGGLFARMWQGKCFEEQNEIGIALGIYEELLGHEGRSGALRSLKDTAQRFRLICLNHEQRKDFELVVQEGQDWLSDAKARSRTKVGLGIQWEMCRAQESLGTNRTIAENLQKNHLNQALNRARAINRYPGELKTPSAAMIQRIMVALNRDPGDPKDFDTAYGNASQLWTEMQAQNDELRKLVAAKKFKEAKEQQGSVQATAGELTRMYDIALRLATPENDPRMVALARMRLAYGYLQQKRYLDSAVVAEHQMLKFGEKYPEIGREAGYIAMAAFETAYSEAEPNDREFEANMVRDAAVKITDRWPESDRANDARNVVAKIYFNSDGLLEAAEWWKKIPKGSDQYNDAQIRAGNAYWRQYVIQAGKKGDEAAKPEDLTAWKEAAIQHLETGLTEAEKGISAESPLPDPLVRAKLTLVNIRNLDGIYTTPKDGPTGALQLLTEGPHSVIKAVTVPDGQKRPDDPTSAKSKQIASFAYQQLLRAQIGLKNLDEARKARKKLEEVAGGEDDAALTQVFVDFGKELEQELERLQAAGEADRLKEVRSGFEAFLNDLFNRKDGQTFYSLLWIAETYASLGDGTGDDPVKAEEFYTKAAQTYQSILDNAAADSSFVSGPSQVLACRLRLVNCLRRQGDYPAGEKQILAVIKESPMAPDAQFEAARLYQDWGSSGSPDAAEKFELALYGTGKESDPHVWGWGYTAQSLQRAIYGKSDPKLEQLHFDARYNLVNAEKEYAAATLDGDKATEHLERARSGIVSFQGISKRWSDEQYERFNALYKEILADLGSPVADLPREPGASPPPPPPDEQGKAIAEVPGAKPGEEPEPGAKSNTLLILLMLGLGGAAVAGLYFMAVGGSKKKYAAYEGKKSKILSGESDPVQISMPAGGVPLKSKPRPKAASAKVKLQSPSPQSKSDAKPKADAKLKGDAKAQAEAKARAKAKALAARKKAAAAGGEQPPVKKRPKKKRPPNPES